MNIIRKNNETYDGQSGINRNLLSNEEKISRYTSSIVWFVVGFVVFSLICDFVFLFKVYSYLVISFFRHTDLINFLLMSLIYGILGIILTIYIPFLVSYYYLKSLFYPTLWLLFLWEIIWVALLIFFHQILKNKSDRRKLVLFSVLIIIGIIPFFLVQFFYLTNNPLISDIIQNATEFIYPPIPSYMVGGEGGILLPPPSIQFIQVYWGIPLWFITWLYMDVINVPQDIVKRRHLNLSQWLWLLGLIIMTTILLMNNVNDFLLYPIWRDLYW